MAVQVLRQPPAGNPRTTDEARAFVKHVEGLFMPWNIDALVDGFTEDCVVRFGIVPEFRGRDALRAFFTTRSQHQANYRLTKQLRSLMGDTITNVWDGTWVDTDTGTPMRGFGVEVWVMHGGRIAVWEAAFNVARADQSAGIAELLR